MAETAQALFSEMGEKPAPEQDHSTGILPSQQLKRLIGRPRQIRSIEAIADDQIQPASLDLRLGAVAYRVRASFLPGRKSTVQEKIDAFAMHRVDLTDGAVLEKGCVYIVPLMESLALKKRTSAIANPKSSIGRLDIFTRLITDCGSEFDRVREQYHGPLYAEISPRTFSVLVREGSRLNQIRIKYGSPPSSDDALRRLHAQVGLIDAKLAAEDIKNGLPISVDARGDPVSGLIGYRARHHAGLIDVDKVRHYDPLDFWEPVHARRDGGLILNPGDFYILASKEAITVPATHAAEMIAYDTLMGEFRVHYAGFFDPGFGMAEADAGGTRAVLEIRSHEVPFELDHGQVVGRLFYDRLIAKPDRLYGAEIGSSYQRQGLALAKQFKQDNRPR
ncbi:MAG: 2'-deoxycytidine 5'-triphosphate deaminase [Alphaproteobacteria bacterium]